MFTGIVEETGIVESIKPTAKSIRLTIEAKRCARGLKLGDSVAVNGCCLTVVKLTTRSSRKLVQFDLLRETWERTNLQFCQAGSLAKSFSSRNKASASPRLCGSWCSPR